MDDEIETLFVDVRASTSGFRSDIETMRGTLDTTLVDGFARAGTVLERGLLSAIRRGSLGFDDLKRVALQTLGEIAAQALQTGLGGLFGNGPPGSGNGGLGALLTGAVGSLFGLPGRATGGPVSPGTPYVVGERGPELFVPTSAGSVAAPVTAGPRELRVAISVHAPSGEAPRALAQSSRQVARAVKAALARVE